MTRMTQTRFLSTMSVINHKTNHKTAVRTTSHGCPGRGTLSPTPRPGF